MKRISVGPFTTRPPSGLIDTSLPPLYRWYDAIDDKDNGSNCVTVTTTVGTFNTDDDAGWACPYPEPVNKSAIAVDNTMRFMMLSFCVCGGIAAAMQ